VDNFRNKVAKANMPELDYSFLEESDGEI